QPVVLRNHLNPLPKAGANGLGFLRMEERLAMQQAFVPGDLQANGARQLTVRTLSDLKFRKSFAQFGGRQPLLLPKRSELLEVVDGCAPNRQAWCRHVAAALASRRRNDKPLVKTVGARTVAVRSGSTASQKAGVSYPMTLRTRCGRGASVVRSRPHG